MLRRPFFERIKVNTEVLVEVCAVAMATGLVKKLKNAFCFFKKIQISSFACYEFTQNPFCQR